MHPFAKQPCNGLTPRTQSTEEKSLAYISSRQLARLTFESSSMFTRSSHLLFSRPCSQANLLPSPFPISCPIPILLWPGPTTTFKARGASYPSIGCTVCAGICAWVNGIMHGRGLDLAYGHIESTGRARWLGKRTRVLVMPGKLEWGREASQITWIGMYTVKVVIGLGSGHPGCLIRRARNHASRI